VPMDTTTPFPIHNPHHPLRIFIEAVTRAPPNRTRSLIHSKSFLSLHLNLKIQWIPTPLALMRIRMPPSLNRPTPSSPLPLLPLLLLVVVVDVAPWIQSFYYGAWSTLSRVKQPIDSRPTINWKDSPRSSSRRSVCKATGLEVTNNRNERKCRVRCKHCSYGIRWI